MVPLAEKSLLHYMPKSAPKAPLPLDSSARHALLRSLWRSRLGDLREQSLIRQGKGWFHISGMGHEALAALALHMEPEDYAFPYYRDRAFCLQRGLTDHDMALAIRLDYRIRSTSRVESLAYLFHLGAING